MALAALYVQLGDPDPATAVTAPGNLVLALSVRVAGLVLAVRELGDLAYSFLRWNIKGISGQFPKHFVVTTPTKSFANGRAGVLFYQLRLSFKCSDKLRS